jgi:hypothetical protein
MAGQLGKKTWEILGYGFQNLGSQLWGLGNFQDMVFRTWDLNFGVWIFTFAISKTET